MPSSSICWRGKDKPDYLPALLGYAELKEQLGQPDEALRLYQRAAKAYPREAAVYNNMGLYYAKLGRADDAVAAMTRAVDAGPEESAVPQQHCHGVGRSRPAPRRLCTLSGGAWRGGGLLQHGLPVEQEGADPGGDAALCAGVEGRPVDGRRPAMAGVLAAVDGAGRVVAASGGQRRKDHQRKGAGGGVVARRADAPPAAADPIGRSVLRRAVVAGCFSGPLGRSHGPDATGERQLRPSAAPPNELKPERPSPTFHLVLQNHTLRASPRIDGRLTAARLPPGRKRFPLNDFRTVRDRGTANYSQRHDDCIVQRTSNRT